MWASTEGHSLVDSNLLNYLNSYPLRMAQQLLAFRNDAYLNMLEQMAATKVLEYHECVLDFST